MAVSNAEAIETALACGVPPEQIEHEQEQELPVPEYQGELADMQAQIDALEARIVEAFEFAANELRPLFGQGTLALVFDGVAEGLRKGRVK